MIYTAIYSEDLLKILDKLAKKDKCIIKIIYNKIKGILENPYHYKPLRGDMKGSRRVHIGHFVLIYEILEEEKKVRFLDFDHHDNVY